MQDILVEQNIIITEPCKTLRTLGRNALAGKWKAAIIAMCVFIIVLELPVVVFDALFGRSVGSLMTSEGYTYGMDADFYTDLYNNMPQTNSWRIVGQKYRSCNIICSSSGNRNNSAWQISCKCLSVSNPGFKKCKIAFNRSFEPFHPLI